MKIKNLGQIIQISLGISVFALLFYIVLGDGVAFYTTSLYNWIGNLIGIGLLLAQCIVHFFILLFISLMGEKTNFAPSKKKQIIWLYVGVAVIANIAIILTTTKDSRAVMSLEHKWKNAEKYAWKYGATTPQGFPIKMIVGYFRLASKSKDAPFQSFGWGVFHGKWGEGFSVSSEYGKSVIPDSLNVTWYSIIENKFYHLETGLDKEKIAKLLKEGFKIKTQHGLEDREYTNITLGLAPGGTVALWVNGRLGASTELAVFKATEIPSSKIDTHSLQDCRAEVAEARKDSTILWAKNINDKNLKIPFGKWGIQYRKKYNWGFVCSTEFPLDSAMVNVSLFNGEAYHITANNLSEKKFEQKALPNGFSIEYYDDKGKHNYLSADFKEQDIFKKFEQLNKNNQNEPITMICNIDQSGSIVSVILKSQHQSSNLDVKTN